MARPSDEFLGQTDPFAGSKPTTWNAGSQSAPFTGGNSTGGVFAGGPMRASGRYVPSTPGYQSGPSFTTPQQQQQVNQQQAFAERSFWAPVGGYGQSMVPGPQTTATVQADIGGRTVYINRDDIDAGGNLKPEAFQRYGIQQGGGDASAGGNPFSTGNLLNVGMQNVNETQRKADEQYRKRDALNRDFANQLQRNRDAMGAGIRDIEDSTRKSENWFLKGIIDYKDLSAEAMSSLARGLRMNAKQMLAEAGAYTRVDGSMKDSQEIEQESRLIRDNLASQIQANLTPLAMQFNDTLLKANQDFAQFLTAQAQLRAAQPLAAIQYDLQGRGYLNDYVAANPQTQVNPLDTLLAIAGIAEGRSMIWGGETPTVSPDQRRKEERKDALWAAETESLLSRGKQQRQQRQQQQASSPVTRSPSKKHPLLNRKVHGAEEVGPGPLYTGKPNPTNPSTFVGPQYPGQKFT